MAEAEDLDATAGEPVLAGPVECDDHCDDLDFSAFEPFQNVLTEEYREIHHRRQVAARTPRGTGRPANLIGLALSGGGIRSATFNLGLLQALQKSKLLERFDYLSTVSGGGYCGGWWSAWLSRTSRKPGKEDFFPDDERIEPERHEERHAGAVACAAVSEEYHEKSDSSMNAGVDPIHHLRLFSNFLTPRVGLLSSDTWRAVTTIGRNLVLTWLILLPLFLAAIMCGQAYFALLTGSDFEHRLVLNKDIDTKAESAEDDAEAVYARTANIEPQAKPEARLQKRLLVALLPSLFLFVGVTLFVVLWMVFTRKCWKLRDIIIVTLTGVAWVGLTLIALVVTQVLPATPLVWQFLGAATVLFLLMLVVGGRRPMAESEATWADSEFWRSRIARVQTRLLQMSVVLAVVLLFAGFGHEVIDFLLYEHRFQTWLSAKIAKAGGWLAVVLSVLGAAYTAIKGSPTGGEDQKFKKPSLVDRIIFTIVPPLLLLVLALFLSWGGHRWYSAVYEDAHDEIWWITFATLISAFLFLSMALYEFRPRSPRRAVVLVVLWALAVAGVMLFVDSDRLEKNIFAICIGSVIFVFGAIFARGSGAKRNWRGIAVAAVLGLGVGITIDILDHGEQLDALAISQLPHVVLIGVFFAVSLLIFELLFAEGSNQRSLALLCIGFAMLVLLGIASCLPAAFAWRLLAMFGCISAVMGWVLSLGWLLDPNVLTVHAFYKARLVRAYLGASNEARGRATDTDITEAVPGDDVALVNLANTSHGAPYHLINTTLNLVGARDLATVQRFSDAFMLSKLYCGSQRTGYRPTDKYACGTMSLGTAVSVSGAAASANMGARTPSSALVMLLTLFNVRLGYWAPTPNRTWWRAGSARLWPYYTIQELLSQTTDLLPFCYLTDGGHFENTGAYALIQRGCRTIVISDCGADPKPPRFTDLGELVRKVRIDFGTKIDLDLNKLRDDDPQSHFLVGTIQYSEAHANKIGLPKEERDGVIIVIKPNLTSPLPADVRQYGFENGEFPQQSTADQWYDEQQFESYRQLGVVSGEAVANEVMRATTAFKKLVG
jgi:hypothetical protein